MTRQDSATARQDRGYSPQSYRVVLARVRRGFRPGLGLAVTRSYGVVMTTQPSLGLLGALGQRLWHGLITAPECAEKRF